MSMNLSLLRRSLGWGWLLLKTVGRPRRLLSALVEGGLLDWR